VSKPSPSRITRRFEQLRSAGRKAFVPYLTVGDPSLELTLDLAHMLEANGADILELGLPFTDPIADGPTNQRAAQRALDRGVRTPDLLRLVRQLRSEGMELPIVLFTYSNPLLQLAQRGPLGEQLEGIDGILVTDLPPEEAGEHIQECRSNRIDTIFLAAPTTPEARLPRLCAATSGFLYYVSSTGVTGARSSLPQDLERRLTALRAHCSEPVCVGFGISTRAVAARVCAVADGYVVGSALGAAIEAACERGEDPVEAARRLVSEIDPREG
jgi:tryptophan synthase alpha chain